MIFNHRREQLVHDRSRQYYHKTTCPVYIKLDAETPRAATRYTLFADGVEVASTEDCLTAVAMWVSTFYVFNMTYPQCATRSLEFVQRVILNITDEMPPSRAILRLTNQLNAFSS
ncbi:hypothetical protein HOLleu_24204 [Holothuria leucospilota]|uniref:Uncharacterized protein n=1 Tax=Holothuria leucospilota TaxID=206669 RepID=A0A9Q1H647_HOLLE|nr:hypothetical protein HOLleu_24204 [Holothuria leucospilota]